MTFIQRRAPYHYQSSLMRIALIKRGLQIYLSPGFD
jgi:hypothetical protein